MKEFTAKDLLGYIKGIYQQECDNQAFYQNAMESREKGTPEYESFKGGYYQAMHTKNVLDDIIRLIEKLDELKKAD